MILGVTGGIGAGKSYVCNVFEHMGIPVYNSDIRAKELYSEKPEIKRQVIDLLGQEAYIGNEPNRQYIAGKVFSDKSLLNELNAIIHPVVGEDFSNWEKKHTDALYLIKEAAILIESGAYKQTDKILVVIADDDTRIRRVVNRDGVSEEEVRTRIKNQMDQHEKVGYADYIVRNNDDDMILQQVLAIHEELIS